MRVAVCRSFLPAVSEIENLRFLRNFQKSVQYIPTGFMKLEYRSFFRFLYKAETENFFDSKISRILFQIIN
ncbi:hypothetical protein LEP1GSC038_4650 [Leptospira weilii str. 2006001855]|uniref:Uncharacterized protein n=1 Tax=Leptospira weilii str. 2006001855 TaxID=996804 RepID=M6FJK7_9LEPT|nr:hypothetical protein LEP1GSC038_4650 [Leptospira weilii str. 2006001855]